jgi:hypothetical protein
VCSGLLTGLLGMHAMGPAGAQMPDHRMSAGAAHGAGAATSAHDECRSEGNGCDQHSNSVRSPTASAGAR